MLEEKNKKAKQSNEVHKRNDSYQILLHVDGEEEEEED